MSLDVDLLMINTKPCPHCGKPIDTDPVCVYSANITHNLNKMASAVGIYKAVWRPEENGIETASQLIPILRKGIVELESDPDHYRMFDDPGGWGLYRNFVPWLKNYLAACEQYPDAKVSVSR